MKFCIRIITLVIVFTAQITFCDAVIDSTIAKTKAIESATVALAQKMANKFNALQEKYVHITNQANKAREELVKTQEQLKKTKELLASNELI